MDVQPHNARLTLDATGTKVVARVVSRSDGGFQVAQSLPFLKLQGGLIDESGRRGRLAGITLDVHGDTPSLVLDVVYDDVQVGMRQSSRPPRRDPTVPFERPSDAPPKMIVVDAALDAALGPARKPSWVESVTEWLRSTFATA